MYFVMKVSRPITIAIDGWAWTGKGTTARWVARILGYRYIDTGALYRAVTLYLVQLSIDLSDEGTIASHLSDISIDFRDDSFGNNQTYLNNVWVEQSIREFAVTQHVAQVASYPCVRAYLLAKQRSFAQKWWVVMDGRDMWSVVVPHAELKVFLTTSLTIRAQRRQQQLREAWEDVSIEDIEKNLRMRDDIDYTWIDPTSTIADDARMLDTSYLTIEEQIQRVVDRAQEILQKM